MATRVSSGKVLGALAPHLPRLLGGSADLAPSNKTYMNCSGEFQKGAYENRNIRFGVREHAMGAIMSGMFLHNGMRPFGGTFFVFADYMRPAIRVASLMKLPLIYVFTHDSVALGEDGPTHQPVEHATALRIIPNLIVIRPADAAETAEALSSADIERVQQFTREPILLPGEEPADVLPGTARRLAVDSALAEDRVVHRTLAAGDELQRLQQRDVHADQQRGQHRPQRCAHCPRWDQPAARSE